MYCNTGLLSILAAVMILCGMTVAEEPGGKPLDLFNGKNLDGWQWFSIEPDVKMKNVWSVTDAVLVCNGEPTGYIATEEDYKNFRLIVEWRWAPGAEPGNNGVLLRITGKPISFLPKCVEAQLKSGSAGDIWGFYGYKLKGAEERFTSVENHDLLGNFVGVGKIKANENAPGEWNRYEITFDGGVLTLVINGEKVNEATDCDVVPGKIGLQSEGGVIHFRTVQLAPLD